MSLLAVSDALIADAAVTNLSLRATRQAFTPPRIQLDFEDLMSRTRRVQPVALQTNHLLEEDAERWDGLS